MSCLEDNTISGFVHGRLAGDALDRVDHHLAGCDACRGLVADCARSLSDDDHTTVPAAAPGAPIAPLAPGQQVGRYVIDRVIGWGGMGIVYAARDPSLNRTITLKFLRPDRLPRGGVDPSAWLLREAQAMAQLSHPNVVSVYDVGAADDQVFVAMEFVEGETLKHWLGPPRPYRDRLAAFVAAGRGLAAAHAVGIIHRDFKPNNVLVGRDGRVRVTDFGLAHPVDHAWQTTEAATKHAFGEWHLGASLTETGAIRGTPAYMAPEQLAGGRVDARSDQYSFCVALYDGLYGVKPGDAIEPPITSQVPAALHAIIARGLARDVDTRYPTMAALLDALEALAIERRPRRRRAAIIAGFAVAGTVAAGIGYDLRNEATTASPVPTLDLPSADQGASLRFEGTVHEAAIARHAEHAARARPRPPTAPVTPGYDDLPLAPAFARKPQ